MQNFVTVTVQIELKKRRNISEQVPVPLWNNYHKTAVSTLLCFILLTWINFDPTIDKQSHAK